MPFVIHCPCGQGLSVHESQSGHVVSCPSCRRSVAVPPVAVITPAQEPFGGLEPEPLVSPERRERYNRKSVTWLTLFLILVGVLVAAAASVFLYEKAMFRTDKERLGAIHDEMIPLMNKMQERERLIEVRNPDPLTRRTSDYERDSQWSEASKRLSELEYEKGQILRRWPELRR